MPKYTNSTSDVIVLGSSRLEPGKSITTVEWFKDLPYGVTQDAVAPYFSPTILSQKLTATETVYVPVSYTNSESKTIFLTGNYKVKIYVGAGECTVKVNSSSVTARYVGLYDTYELTCNSRVVDNVIVTISSGTVYVSVELA